MTPDVATGYLASPEALPATVVALRSGMPPEWSSYLVIDPVEDLVVGSAGSRTARRRGRGDRLQRGPRPPWTRARHRRGGAVARPHNAEGGLVGPGAHPGGGEPIDDRPAGARVAEIDDAEDGPVWRWERAPVRTA